MLVLAWIVGGVADFMTDDEMKNEALYGQMSLVEAILQTVGAMIIAASDIDIDIFAKRYPGCVLAFALAWIVIYQGLSMIALPFVIGLAILPFAYLLLRFRAVLQMRSQAYPRFSDLFAYSLSSDLLANGVFLFAVCRCPNLSLSLDLIPPPIHQVYMTSSTSIYTSRLSIVAHGQAILSAPSIS
jgi:hypothetical protein